MREKSVSAPDLFTVIITVVAVCIVALFTFLTWPAKIHSGMNDGVSYSYWQKFGSCRELTLTYPDGMVVTIYDENDNNIVGDVHGDYYRVNKGENYVCYTHDDIKKNDWNDEVLIKEAAFNRATEIFQQWRPIALGG